MPFQGLCSSAMLSLFGHDFSPNERRRTSIPAASPLPGLAGTPFLLPRRNINPTAHSLSPYLKPRTRNYQMS